MTETTECKQSKKLKTSEIFAVCDLPTGHSGLHQYTIKWRLGIYG